MTARVLRPAITFTTVIAVLAAALAVYSFLSAGGARADSLFRPTTTVEMCNALPAGFSSTDASLAGTGPGCAQTLTAGTATDYTVTLNMPSGDLNFSNVVTLSPNGPTSVAVGAKVGGLRSLTNLGLVNNQCSTALTVDFIMWNTAIPNAATRAGMTNIAWPNPEGTTDRFSDWRVDDGVHTSNPPSTADPEWADETDADVIDIGNGANADGTTLSIQNYPVYLLDIFDPDFVPGVGDNADGGANLEPLIPTATYGGLTLVSGNWIPLYFVVFPAGGLTTLPTPLGAINSTMGSPSVSVLTDPSAVQASPSSISDFCTSLNVTTMLRSTIHTNPAAGTQYFLQYIASQRDTDQDSFENQIDTCPYSGGVGVEEPRATLGAGDNDSDNDHIKDSCDLNLGDSDDDDENDLFQNRQDNCPQVSNPLQQDSEISVTAPDYGPRTDGIGDACDGAEGGTGGALTVTQNGSSVILNGTCGATSCGSVAGAGLSDTVANGRYMSRTNVVPKCIEAVDTDDDNDGYCDAQDNADSGACAATVPTSCFIRHTSWNVGACATNPGCQMDSDGDTVTPTAGVISKWTDAIETYLGTDETKPCAQSNTANNETPLDNMPLDFDDNRTVTGADWLKVAGVINNGGSRAINLPPASGLVTAGTNTTAATLTVAGMGTQSQQRFDLNHDGQLALGSDLGKFNAYMGKPCGSAGTAPTTANGSGIFQH